MAPLVRHASVGGALLLAAAALGSPLPARADAELASSDPANGSTVPAGFAGPIALTFTEGLASGSRAELAPAGGPKLADAAIDATDAKRLVFAPSAPLAPGSWTIQWVTIAADRHIKRGTVAFAVAPPTPSPTAPPTPAPTIPPTLAPTASPQPTPSPLPFPSPAPTVDASPTAGDVLPPIVAALGLVGAAALLLLRRRGGRA